MQVSSSLESINTREVDCVLVEVLKRVGDEEDGHDTPVDLAKDPLHLCRIIFVFSGGFVNIVAVIKVLRRRWGDVICVVGRNLWGGTNMLLWI